MEKKVSNENKNILTKAKLSVEHLNHLFNHKRNQCSNLTFFLFKLLVVCLWLISLFQAANTAERIFVIYYFNYTFTSHKTILDDYNVYNDYINIKYYCCFCYFFFTK